MRITLSPYTMATNCTDITDCNDGISELWDACDRYKAAGQKVPEYIYKRIEKLHAKRDKCSLKEHGMKHDEWLMSRFDKLEGASDGYIEAYKEALKKWLKYQNYKGDKRSTVYHILRDNADSAREFLWQTPDGLPNIIKIGDWYFDEDITDYDTMAERIFGGLQGTKKADQSAPLSGTDAPKYANKETVYYSGHAFDDSRPEYKSQSGYYPVKILFYKNGKYMVFWTKFGARKQFYATEDELSREIPTTEPKPETAEFKIGDRFVGQDGTTYTITNIRSYDEIDDDYLKATLERNKSKYLYDLTNGSQTLAFWAAKIKEMFKPVGDNQPAEPTADEPKPGELTEAEKEKLRSYQGKGGSKDTTERGILDEYYTPDYVCEFMYRLAVKYGYTAGKVLEPSCATGNCIRPIYERNDYTHIDAFEINQTSRDICKKLYPDVNLYENYFETAFLEPPRYTIKAKKTWLPGAPYDLVIGNPPYGKHVNRYSAYFSGKDRFAQVEMFFMCKCLELLRSGGLLVFITSTNFMSTGSAYQQTKDRIGEMAELVDAYRLPKVFTNTDICTDIIVLRKK